MVLIDSGHLYEYRVIYILKKFLSILSSLPWESGFLKALFFS